MTVEQTLSPTSTTFRDTPHPPTEPSSSPGEIPIAKVTSGPPRRTPSDPQEATLPGPTVLTNVTPDEHGEGVESRPKVTKEAHSNTRDTVKGAVRLALDITESLSAGVPFLPGASMRRALSSAMNRSRASRYSESIPRCRLWGRKAARQQGSSDLVLIPSYGVKAFSQ